MTTSSRQLQLLAPARNADIAIQAILHGADAVYMGASSHGARIAATNTVDDIHRVADFAHKYGVKVYVTVNTIIYDRELYEVESLVKSLYYADVDAIIVQDMAFLKLNIPPIALHASTQCDTRTPERARFLQDVGFSQIVIPRELSPDEIRLFSRETEVPLEAFCHGALCVSYSGDCRAGFMATGRSSNRGECPQMCRLPYDLIDGNGKKIVSQKHLLSLFDLNRISIIEEMADAGVSSFKIEGRLKDAAYVKNAVAAYRQALDAVISNSNGKYIRSSFGSSEITFTPNLRKGFNRGFTTYLFPAGQNEKMACINTPKMTGIRVGTISGIGSSFIDISLDKGLSLANGDGLGYFRQDEVYDGFRVNRVQDSRIWPQVMPVGLYPGMILYRNNDKAWNDTLSRNTAQRNISLSMTLRKVSKNIIVLDLADERGCTASSSIILDEPIQWARTEQTQQRKNILEKLGDTHYKSGHINDQINPNLFIPISRLACLRRNAIAALEISWKSRRKTEKRKNPKTDVPLPEGSLISYRYNVANRLAKDFYLDHGAISVEPAVEVKRPETSVQIMECRYCIRRELGACLKTPQGKILTSPLFLDNGRGTRYAVKFDCSRCIMSLYLTK